MSWVCSLHSIGCLIDYATDFISILISWERFIFTLVVFTDRPTAKNLFAWHLVLGHIYLLSLEIFVNLFQILWPIAGPLLLLVAHSYATYLLMPLNEWFKSDLSSQNFSRRIKSSLMQTVWSIYVRLPFLDAVCVTNTDSCRGFHIAFAFGVLNGRSLLLL